jgi:hypothetical protein
MIAGRTRVIGITTEQARRPGRGKSYSLGLERPNSRCLITARTLASRNMVAADFWESRGAKDVLVL